MELGGREREGGGQEKEGDGGEGDETEVRGTMGRAKEVGVKIQVGGGRKVEMRVMGVGGDGIMYAGDMLRGGQVAKREAVCGARRTTEKTSGESAVHQIAAFTTLAHWPTRKPFMIGSITM